MREMPFDLFFFRFISPFILKYLKPSVAFSNFVRTWFEFVAHRLRMSHFLLGTEREDEELLPSHQNDLTYMRVPNHDRVEPIGWSRMHIRMKKEDPIFGNERDQTENVARNWTKVYAPDKLRLRVFSLLGLQWITFSIGLFLFITLPTLFGRMVFAGLQSLTTFSADIPKSYVNPVDVIRNDVPVHDFYSFILGLLLIASLFSIVKVISMIMLTLAQYKRLSHSLQMGGTPPKAFTLTDFIRMKLLVFQPQLAKKFFRAAYLAFMIGILIPLTIGLVLDYYLISTLYLSMKSRAIVFYIIAWSTGAITTRLIYQLVLLNPENRYAILINNANRLGLMQANLTILTKSIFLPVLAGGIFALILPSISRLFENETGESIFTVGIEDVMVLPVLLLTYSSFKLLNSSFNSLWRWILRLREEEYIIGRRLENVTDEQAP